MALWLPTHSSIRHAPHDVLQVTCAQMNVPSRSLAQSIVGRSPSQAKISVSWSVGPVGRRALVLRACVRVCVVSFHSPIRIHARVMYDILIPLPTRSSPETSRARVSCIRRLPNEELISEDARSISSGDLKWSVTWCGCLCRRYNILVERLCSVEPRRLGWESVRRVSGNFVYEH
jgi:hypothetical protein